MRDVTDQLHDWLNAGDLVALATVVDTWGSSPRKVGAKMGINANGEMVGSVSGGCVEAAVAELALQVLKNNTPQLVHYGVSDETAWDVGLACGGEIEVFVERLRPSDHHFLHEALHDEDPAARLIVTTPGAPGHDSWMAARGNEAETIYGDAGGLDTEAAVQALKDGIRRGRSASVTLPLASGEAEVDAFVDVLAPPDRLILIGGVHISVALAALAHQIGYRVVVIDPRRAFASVDRFPAVDELVHGWPKQALRDQSINTATAVAVLTHDPKIDDPALIEALPSPAYYVGALGSRRTQEKRRQRLLDAGVAESDLARLRGPIGLDIGAQTPEEIALSIMAEVVKAKYGG